MFWEFRLRVGWDGRKWNEGGVCESDLVGYDQVVWIAVFSHDSLFPMRYRSCYEVNLCLYRLTTTSCFNAFQLIVLYSNLPSTRLLIDNRLIPEWTIHFRFQPHKFIFFTVSLVVWKTQLLSLWIFVLLEKFLEVRTLKWMFWKEQVKIRGPGKRLVGHFCRLFAIKNLVKR